MDISTIDRSVRLTGVLACIGAMALIASLAAAGFVVRLLRADHFWRSLQFTFALVAVPLLCPGDLAALTAATVRHSGALARGGASAAGTIIRVQEERAAEGGATFRAIVEFQTADGVGIEFEDGNTSNPPAYQVGQAGPVTYDSSVPQ